MEKCNQLITKEIQTFCRIFPDPVFSLRFARDDTSWFPVGTGVAD